jgi:hypothetical protein
MTHRGPGAKQFSLSNPSSGVPAAGDVGAEALDFQVAASAVAVAVDILAAEAAVIQVGRAGTARSRPVP